jgi:hypothetical protein
MALTWLRFSSRGYSAALREEHRAETMTQKNNGLELQETGARLG